MQLMTLISSLKRNFLSGAILSSKTKLNPSLRNTFAKKNQIVLYLIAALT